MKIYTNKPEKPDFKNVDLATLPKSAMLGNFEPYYLYNEVVNRLGEGDKSFDLVKEIKFQEPNIFLSRMCAFRHASEQADAFALMKAVAAKAPINLGKGAGFEVEDNFSFEIWIVTGEAEDDRALVWDSNAMLDSLVGSVTESALFELLMIPGANPSKSDYNPA